MARRVKVGDVLEIPTKRGLAYCQITHIDKVWGSLIRALPGFFEATPSNFSGLVTEPELFRAFIPASAAVNRNIFRIAGNEAVPAGARSFPIFRAGVRDPKTGKAKNWWLWDGEREWMIGELNAEQRKLPIRSVWNDTLLVERLETGWRSEMDVS